MNREKFILSSRAIFSGSKEELIKRRENYHLEFFQEHIIAYLINRKNEDDYLILDKFIKEDANFLNHLQVVREDLHEAGWKTQLSFNDTGLFIFKDKVPKTCW